MTLPCLIVDKTREPRCWPRAVPSLLLVLGLCAACGGANTVQTASPSQEVAAPTDSSAGEFELRDDCEWGVSGTICDGPPAAPGPELHGAVIVASVHVQAIEPTLFNTASGLPPDEPYDPEVAPEDSLDATVEAVFRGQAGPDWEEREWDDAMRKAQGTAEAIEADFYDRWREHHPFAVGHLVVMRVEPEPGVLRGEPALGWVVSFMRGGRAEVKEGRHAGCVFEEQYSGCQEYVEQGQSGLALAHPVSEGRADYFHFFDHCVARAAELERETGTPARCMELSWFLREAEEGWRWEGGMEEGVLDLATVSEMMSEGGGQGAAP